MPKNKVNNNIKLKSGGGITTDANGLSINSSELPDNLFGDGSDGDVVISVNTDLARDMYYQNLTIDTGVILNPNGYKIYVAGVLSGAGTIQVKGGDGGNGTNATGGVVGAAGAAGVKQTFSGPLFAGVDGKAGRDGTSASWTAPSIGLSGIAGAALNPSLGVNGSAGGGGGYNPSGGSGGGGGAAGTATGETLAILKLITSTNAAANSETSINNNLYRILSSQGSSSGLVLSSSAGSGSGGSGGGFAGSGSSCRSGGSGGSGASGGVILIFAKTISGTLSINSLGGNGGNAGAGNATGDSAIGGSGGGAGGSGGVVILVYKSLTGATISVAGGSGGNKSLKVISGAGNVSTTDGSDGAAGLTGTYYKIKLT